MPPLGIEILSIATSPNLKVFKLEIELKRERERETTEGGSL